MWIGNRIYVLKSSVQGLPRGVEAASPGCFHQSGEVIPRGVEAASLHEGWKLLPLPLSVRTITIITNINNIITTTFTNTIPE